MWGRLQPARDFSPAGDARMNPAAGRAKATPQAEACPTPVSRRGFFNRVSDGLYGAALAGLFSKDLYGATLEGVRRSYDLKPRPPHFEPKATSVIQLFMHGGPSQMDLFDPKSTLDKN